MNVPIRRSYEIFKVTLLSSFEYLYLNNIYAMVHMSLFLKDMFFTIDPSCSDRSVLMKQQVDGSSSNSLRARVGQMLYQNRTFSFHSHVLGSVLYSDSELILKHESLICLIGVG